MKIQSIDWLAELTYLVINNGYSAHLGFDSEKVMHAAKESVKKICSKNKLDLIFNVEGEFNPHFNVWWFNVEENFIPPHYSREDYTKEAFLWIQIKGTGTVYHYQANALRVVLDSKILNKELAEGFKLLSPLEYCARMIEVLDTAPPGYYPPSIIPAGICKYKAARMKAIGR